MNLAERSIASSSARINIKERLVYCVAAIAVAGLVVLCVGASSAQTAAPASSDAKNTDHPDLSGEWTRLDMVGGGSWDGVNAARPKPVYVPGYQPGGPRPQVQSSGPHAAGEPYIVTTGSCGTASIPGSLEHSSAFTIVQSKDETLLIFEAPGSQHIYTDGRAHPDPASYRLSARGHAIGHWEGDTFVVDTVGLGGRGLAASPEGNHVIERMKLVDGGKRMTIGFTWDNPKIYAQPWTYTEYYERRPADAHAMEEWCDSSDPLQKQSIVPPPQN